jgi:2-polyprenyl-3-methyl-5-hydroxy-6-metoxy-1,4-benzoquinol methylase
MNDWKDLVYQSYVSVWQSYISEGKSVDYGNEQLRMRRPYFQSIIRSHFPSDRAVRVLDLGCGYGGLLYYLEREGYRNARGIDLSQEQVQLSRRLGVHGVEVGDVRTFLSGCESASEDVICLLDVIEHFSRSECFDLLSEVRRVLAPGGICIGHVPNAGGVFGMRARYDDLTHEQAFTHSSLSMMFGTLNYAQVRCYEDKPVPHGLKSAARRVLWEVVTAPFRLVHIAETGAFDAILSRNLLFVVQR